MSRLFDALKSFEKRSVSGGALSGLDGHKGIATEKLRWLLPLGTAGGIFVIGIAVIFFASPFPENDARLITRTPPAPIQAGVSSGVHVLQGDEAAKNHAIPDAGNVEEKTEEKPLNQERSDPYQELTALIPTTHTEKALDQKDEKAVPRVESRTKAPLDPPTPVTTSGTAGWEAERSPKGPLVDLLQAEALRLSGRISEAIPIYERAWKERRNIEAGNNLAACLMLQGRFGEALDILEEALLLAPNDSDIRYNLLAARDMAGSEAGR